MPTYNVKIALAQAKVSPLVYKILQKLPIGSIVRVPLRTRTCYGILIEYHKQPVSFAVKPAEWTGHILPKTTLAFLTEIAHFSYQSIGAFLDVMLAHYTPHTQPYAPHYKIDLRYATPAAKLHLQMLTEDNTLSSHILHVLGPRLLQSCLQRQALIPSSSLPNINSTIHLSPAQTKSYAAICNHGATLLEGVTGSGKTEIYLQWCIRFLQKGLQVLIITPTVNLVEQTADRIYKTLNIQPIRWHNMASKKYKEYAWHLAHSGHPLIVVGARSALFLPLSNLGCIILDEEHDNCAYKQDCHPFYHARSCAFILSKAHNVPIVFATATPSLESRVAAEEKKISHTKIPHSFHKNQKIIQIIDMGKTPPMPNHYITEELYDLITHSINSQQQALLFMNRRGFAPLTLCTQCGLRLTCKHCSTFYVYHKKHNKLLCHYCQHSIALPSLCPHCQHPDIILYGPAIERIEEEVQGRFPKQEICVLSSDTFTSHSKLSSILEHIHTRKPPLIISTQILTTGVDLPNLNLIGIIDGDMGRSPYDIRANEHAAQLLIQTMGRCGRRHQKSTVAIQTFQPNSPLLKMALTQDMDSFYKAEQIDRKKYKLPPYYRVALIRMHSKNIKELSAFAQRCAHNAPPPPAGISIYGPSESPMAIQQGVHRMFFAIHAPSRRQLLAYLEKWTNLIPRNTSVDLSIDTEPVSFL